ncbi:MAG TPA: hypothetical protein PLP15_05480 [Bacilli bacterium]|nr:hypothetical protein [Bacilli bacterium]
MMVRKCDEALQRIAFFEGIYCYSLEEIEDLIRLTYPAVSDEQIAGWIARGELESSFWDNEERYIELTHYSEAAQEKYTDMHN